MNQEIITDKPKRITFIDLTRAYAIIMMVQGHTIDLVLNNKFRINSTLYDIWEYNRGVTAPLFLFMSGVIFTYLLIRNQKPEGNPRIKKGIKRGLMLIAIGYALQFNTSLIFNFPQGFNTPNNYAIIVHVLQCIGVGLISLVGLFQLARVTKLSYFWILIISGLLFLGLQNVVPAMAWLDHIPVFFANFITPKFGSHFPMFPFLGYLLLGAAMGSTIQKYQKFYTSYKFGLSLIIVCAFGLFISYVALPPIRNPYLYYHPNNSLPNLIMFDRIWVVGVIIGIFSLISVKFTNINPFLLTMGKNTLWIYVVHHFILYYTLFIPGPVIYFFQNKLDPWQSVFCALGVLVLVLTLLYVYTKLVKKYHPKYLKLK
ncbi:MAG: heparan-alpha-glucosaminide N-acetyltransferase domain-containing protein [bacterium]